MALNCLKRPHYRLYNACMKFQAQHLHLPCLLKMFILLYIWVSVFLCFIDISTLILTLLNRFETMYQEHSIFHDPRVMGHMGHRSKVQLVTWVMGHMDHGSRVQLVTWVMGNFKLSIAISDTEARNLFIRSFILSLSHLLAYLLTH